MNEEEMQNGNAVNQEPTDMASADSTTQFAPAEEASTPVEEAAAPSFETTYQEPAAAMGSDEPQIIIQKERGFAHYVGFALLCVLCIIFYFLPGIALTFAISLIPGISLGAVAAWTFSALLSVIAWVIFKIKIKGFKKSFFFYIGLCVAVFAILLAIEVLTENYNLFSNIFAMLFGAS